MLGNLRHTILGIMFQKSCTTTHRDNNTHLNIFGDKTYIYFPEFSFHMKHMGYFSPTMNSYMVSLKSNFNELRSRHWLYTNTFTDISDDIPIINNVDSKLHQIMMKLMEVVKWI